MATQENLSKPYPERQTLIELNGKFVWIDNEFVVLVQELNRLGLITRSHCAGHESNNAWIVIRMDTITDIEMRNWNAEYKELLLKWERPRTNKGEHASTKEMEAEVELDKAGEG